ncbi:MAG: endopeptidase La [Chloroflexota bacterium]
MPRRKRKSAPADLPVLPVRDTVLFPHVVTPLYIDRDRSLRAIEEAMGTGRTLLVLAQRDPDVQRPRPEDLYEVGTEAIVGRVLKMPDGSTSALVQGQRRVRVVGPSSDDQFLRLLAEPVEEPRYERDEVEALMRAVLGLYEKSVRLSRTIQDEHYVAAMNIDEPGWLADFVVSDLDIAVSSRQEVLETIDPVERLQRASLLLAKELDVLELQSRIHSQVQAEVDSHQREFFLREQIKAIQKELGEQDSHTRELARLREKIEAAGLPTAARERADEELDRMAGLPTMSPEIGMVRAYLEWLGALPWSTTTTDNLDVDHAARVLERNHHGLASVKDRILEYIAVRKLAADRMRSPILCFVGPPGVGKTSLGRSVAEALGRKFARVSLGGVRDEAEIRGHRRTYIGSLPGRIIQTMRTAGSANPVFVLDEIDKLGLDFRGDPSSALLEVLDPEQNSAFSDHYLEVPFDLSRVMFIATANMLDPVPAALRDRMEVIELSGYIEDEKVAIARRFLVPRQIREHGLRASQLRLPEATLRQVVREYTREAGVRNLERHIGTICRKVARKVATGDPPRPTISARGLAEWLGPARYRHNAAELQDQIGVATGVSWTPVGGDVMTVETTLMTGKGQLTLTGQLGDVMKESAQAALSYARARAHELGVADRFYENTDIHIHVPAGAIPKDGPSAGITMATALLSALTRRPAHRQVAMTGEITLRGRILPVGGVREKVIAAHRAGMKTFVLPQDNLVDLDEVPVNARRGLDFVPVATMDQVLRVALGKQARTTPSAR